MKYGDVPKAILEASLGSIAKAEILKDKQEIYVSIDKVINGLENLNLVELFKIADVIYKSQDDIMEILEYINIILFKKAKNNLKYLECINVIEETKRRLKANHNYNMAIDNMIMSIWEEIH